MPRTETKQRRAGSEPSRRAPALLGNGRHWSGGGGGPKPPLLGSDAPEDDELTKYVLSQVQNSIT